MRPLHSSLSCCSDTVWNQPRAYLDLPTTRASFVLSRVSESPLRREKCVQHLIPVCGSRVKWGAASNPGHTDAPGPPGEVAPIVRQVTHAVRPLPGGAGAGGFGPRYCWWVAVYCHKGEQASFLCLVIWGQTYESLWISAVYGTTVIPFQLYLATCCKFL